MNLENSSRDSSNNDSGTGAKMGELGLQFVEQFEMNRVLEKFYEQIREVVSNAEIAPDITSSSDGEARSRE